MVIICAPASSPLLASEELATGAPVSNSWLLDTMIAQETSLSMGPDTMKGPAWPDGFDGNGTMTSSTRLNEMPVLRACFRHMPLFKARCDEHCFEVKTSLLNDCNVGH